MQCNVHRQATQQKEYKTLAHRETPTHVLAHALTGQLSHPLQIHSLFRSPSEMRFKLATILCWVLLLLLLFSFCFNDVVAFWIVVAVLVSNSFPFCCCCSFWCQQQQQWRQKQQQQQLLRSLYVIWNLCTASWVHCLFVLPSITNMKGVSLLHNYLVSFCTSICLQGIQQSFHSN